MEGSLQAQAPGLPRESSRPAGKSEWTPEKIAHASDTWCIYPGWEGDTCFRCGLTANVLAGGPGWFCDNCGEYMVQCWHGGPKPHDHPDAGPDLATIRKGHNLSDKYRQALDRTYQVQGTIHDSVILDYETNNPLLAGIDAMEALKRATYKMVEEAMMKTLNLDMATIYSPKPKSYPWEWAKKELGITSKPARTNWRPQYVLRGARTGTEFFAGGIVSGRLSSSEPELQQLPSVWTKPLPMTWWQAGTKTMGEHLVPKETADNLAAGARGGGKTWPFFEQMAQDILRLCKLRYFWRPEQIPNLKVTNRPYRVKEPVKVLVQSDWHIGDKRFDLPLGTVDSGKPRKIDMAALNQIRREMQDAMDPYRQAGLDTSIFYSRPVGIVGPVSA